MPPRDFWRLHPTEFWWLFEARRPRQMFGSLTDEEVADLYDEAVDLGMLKPKES